jgi:hypothetical protein
MKRLSTGQERARLQFLRTGFVYGEMRLTIAIPPITVTTERGPTNHGKRQRSTFQHYFASYTPEHGEIQHCGDTFPAAGKTQSLPVQVENKFDKRENP